MRKLTLGSAPEMGPVIEPGGIGEPPQTKMGPILEPGGIAEPPQTEMGPVIEPDG